MEVAIMGAGMSGLSCAITLEKLGINPVIFEKRNRVGDRFINAEAMFNILNRPIKDCLPYISENYHINLEPIDEVDKLFIHTKNELGSIDGKIGNYKCDLTCTIKGATVQGEFMTSNPHVWFNYEIIPKGYAWLIPFTEEEVNLVIAYPDYPDNIRLDINDMWERFYNLASKEIDQNLKITDNFEITRYMVGICNKAKIDNTYFIGNCFGTISPGLGFGQFTSIFTGIYSAYDICGSESYDKLAKPLFENYNHSIVFRRFMESLTDDEIDSYVKNLNNKNIDKFIDRLCSNYSRIDVIKLLTPAMRISNDHKAAKG